MNVKRITSILFILLGYIALAGAMQSIISHFTPTKPELPYAEVRIDADKHVQVLICKDWVLKPENMDFASSSASAEVGQDVYYWIDLNGMSESELFTKMKVHANGPVPQHDYHGIIRWAHDQKQISINLHRAASTSASTPFGGNGTYVIRKITSEPFMQENSN
jgi:hypothetical protein